MHLWVLRELADEAANPLSVIYEKLWQSGEVPTEWKRGNIAPPFEKKKEKKKTWGTAGHSVLTLCLARS